MSAHPTFNEGPKKTPSLAKCPKSVLTVHSFPDSYHPGLPVFIRKAFFYVLLQGFLRCPLRFAQAFILYK